MNVLNKKDEAYTSKFIRCLKTLASANSSKKGIDLPALLINLSPLCDEYIKEEEGSRKDFLINELTFMSVGLLHNLKLLFGARAAKSNKGIALYDMATDFEIYSIGILLSGKIPFEIMKGALND